ncbi:hypothetical protein ABEB36_002651 [Hypothenemus hampei]|uniref:CHK kinase-like domain-containing protein n=1 Tax=Hypothenemus hampei TaxID=57062 RepID=A0ABD1F955_HYPHA
MMRKVAKLVRRDSTSYTPLVHELTLAEACTKAALSAYFGGEVKILETVIEKEPAYEENPEVLVYRVLVYLPTNEKVELSLCKKSPRECDFQPVCQMDIGQRFKKEMIFYTVIMKKIREFEEKLQNRALDPDDKFETLFRKCYHGALTLPKEKKEPAKSTQEPVEPVEHPNKTGYIITENVEPQGYQIEYSKNGFGFDFDTSMMAIVCLAKFHAIILAFGVSEQEKFNQDFFPILLDVQDLDFDSDGQEPMEELNCILERLEKAYKNHKELEAYEDVIRKTIDYSLFNNWYRPSWINYSWHTIIHGKFSMKNILVKRSEENKALHCKIASADTLGFDSCIKDLIYFLFTSVDDKLLLKEWSQFLEIYLKTFVETLETYNVNKDLDISTSYSFNEFIIELKIQTCKNIVHILLDLMEFYQDSSTDEILFNEKGYRNKVKNILVFITQRNWIAVGEEWDNIRIWSPSQKKKQQPRAKPSESASSSSKQPQGNLDNLAAGPSTSFAKQFKNILTASLSRPPNLRDSDSENSSSYSSDSPNTVQEVFESLSSRSSSDSQSSKEPPFEKLPSRSPSSSPDPRRRVKASSSSRSSSRSPNLREQVLKSRTSLSSSGSPSSKQQLLETSSPESSSDPIEQEREESEILATELSDCSLEAARQNVEEPS